MFAFVRLTMVCGVSGEADCHVSAWLCVLSSPLTGLCCPGAAVRVPGDVPLDTRSSAGKTGDRARVLAEAGPAVFTKAGDGAALSDPGASGPSARPPAHCLCLPHRKCVVTELVRCGRTGWGPGGLSPPAWPWRACPEQSQAGIARMLGPALLRTSRRGSGFQCSRGCLSSAQSLFPAVISQC